MSHFTVLVIGDDLEGQLAPYNEQIEVDQYLVDEVSDEDKQQCVDYYNKEGKTKSKRFDYVYKKFGEDWDGGRCAKNEKGVWCEYSTYNPKSKWDWYQTGGRWTGFFKLKKNATGETGKPGLMTEPADEGFADVVTVGDVDFVAMRAEAKKGAEKFYDEVMAVIGHLPVNKTRDEMIGDTPRGDELNKLRDEYWAQERCVALKAAKIVGWSTSPDEFLISREEYASNAENLVGVPYAFVKDGQWYQHGEMGWWGMSSDEMSQAEWNAKVHELYNSLSKDTQLTLVDCHI